MGGAGLSQPGLLESLLREHGWVAFSSGGSRWSVPGAVKLYQESVSFGSKWFTWRLVKIKVCVVEGLFSRGVSVTTMLLVLKIGARICPPEFLLAKLGPEGWRCALPNTPSPGKCSEDI